ncbi:hypothetical protein GLYMA_16G157850v4 [Glycine max]|nr:hypothetical protein GLYMA_16G157850v4 [Glycine max]KAH1151618.1 hypothetical protein GYH30_045226 [Glycine max]
MFFPSLAMFLCQHLLSSWEIFILCHASTFQKKPSVQQAL